MKKNSAVGGDAAFPPTLVLLKKPFLAVLQAALDIFIYSFCLTFFTYLRGSPSGFWPERRVFLCSLIFVIFLFNSLYYFRNWMFWDEMKAVLRSSIIALLILVTYTFSLKLTLSRLILYASFLLFVPLCLLARYVLRRAAVALGLLRTPMLVIGAGKTGELYARKVASHPFMGCVIVGFLDDDDDKQGTTVAGLPVLGKLKDFERFQRQFGVEEVVVAISTASRKLLARLLDLVEMRVRCVHYIPDMYMLTTFSASIRDVDGVPLISASQGLLNPLNRTLKHVMDYLGALVALLVFSPLFCYIAWRIKKDDGGTAFFAHSRVGKNLKPFKMYKFRTMIPDAEKVLQEMLKDEKLRQEFEVAFKFKDDPRITKLGRFLRRTSLDELPQLFNVLKGEMSLVGPRPIVMREVELYYGQKTAQQIFKVTPGLTGFWQVSGRNDVLDYQQRIELDLYYIRNWSPWLDIVILLRTVQVILTSKGAY
ncbi:MAG: sugar transferase [Fretibacterium sp.]|nr:sugar transferase [Fretibacterium sp.]